MNKRSYIIIFELISFFHLQSHQQNYVFQSKQWDHIIIMFNIPRCHRTHQIVNMSKGISKEHMHQLIFAAQKLQFPRIRENLEEHIRHYAGKYRLDYYNQENRKAGFKINSGSEGEKRMKLCTSIGEKRCGMTFSGEIGWELAVLTLVPFKYVAHSSSLFTKLVSISNWKSQEADPSFDWTGLDRISKFLFD